MTTNALQAFYNQRATEVQDQDTASKLLDAVFDPIVEIAKEGDFDTLVDIIAGLCAAPIEHIEGKHESKELDLNGTRKAQTVQEMFFMVANLAVEMRNENNDTTKAVQYLKLPAVFNSSIRDRFALIEAIVQVYKKSLNIKSEQLLDGTYEDEDDATEMLKLLVYFQKQVTRADVMISALDRAAEMCN